MGMHAAHCMTGVAADTGTSFAFELFTHATQFMGQKVVLLGLYNGQRLEKEPEADMVTYSRATEVCYGISLQPIFTVLPITCNFGFRHISCFLNTKAIRQPSR